MSINKTFDANPEQIIGLGIQLASAPVGTTEEKDVAINISMNATTEKVVPTNTETKTVTTSISTNGSVEKSEKRVVTLGATGNISLNATTEKIEVIDGTKEVSTGLNINFETITKKEVIKINETALLFNSIASKIELPYNNQNYLFRTNTNNDGTSNFVWATDHWENNNIADSSGYVNKDVDYASVNVDGAYKVKFRFNTTDPDATVKVLAHSSWSNQKVLYTKVGTTAGYLEIILDINPLDISTRANMAVLVESYGVTTSADTVLITDFELYEDVGSIEKEVTVSIIGNGNANYHRHILQNTTNNISVSVDTESIEKITKVNTLGLNLNASALKTGVNVNIETKTVATNLIINASTTKDENNSVYLSATGNLLLNGITDTTKVLNKENITSISVNGLATKSYTNLGDLGNLVIDSTIRNKYNSDGFIDKQVIKGKTYKYTAIPYNDAIINSNTPENKDITIIEPTDVTPPAQITNFLILFDGTVKIKFTDPVDLDWDSTIIRRKQDSKPSNRDDGTLVVNSTIRNQYKDSYLVDDTIEEGKVYYYRAFTKDVNGNYNETDMVKAIAIPVISVNVPPSNITNLKIEVVNTSTNVTWNDSNDSNWISTAVVRNTDHIPENHLDGTTIVINTVRDQYSNSGFEDIGLVEKQTYYYKAFPLNEVGLYNVNSNYEIIDIADKTPTSIVTNLVVDSDVDQIHINYTDPVDNDWKGTRLVRKIGSAPTSVTDGVLIIDSIIRDQFSNTSFIDESVTLGNVYYYKAFPYDSAKNYNENSSVKSASLIDNVPPAVVTNFNIEQNEDKLIVKWINPSTIDWVGTDLLYKVGSVSANQNDGIKVGSSFDRNSNIELDINNFVVGERYYFKAFPYDINGNYNINGTSQLQVISDITPPEIVSGFSVVLTDNNSIEIKWNDPNDIDWKVTTLVRKENSESININDGNVVITTISRDLYSTNGYIDSNLDFNKNYYYKTYTKDIAGNINDDGPSVLITTGDPKFDAQVTDLVANVNNNHVELTWTDPTDLNWAVTKIVRNETHFPVDESDGSLVAYSENKNQYVSNVLTDRNVEAGKMYYYAAFCKNSSEVWSEIPTIISTTVVDSIAPNPVYVISIEKQEDNSVYINWEDPTNEDWSGTKLVRKIGSVPTDENDGTIIVDSKNRNQYAINDQIIDTDIEDSTTYYYKAFPYDNDDNVNLLSRSIQFVSNDLTPPAEATNLNVVQVYNSENITVALTWEDPSDADWKITKIIMKQDSEPTNDTDGTYVALSDYKDRRKIEAAEITVSADKHYYFKAFTYDSVDNVNTSSIGTDITTVGMPNVGVSTISVDQVENTVVIKVNDRNDLDWDGTYLVKKSGSEPKNQNDGTLVVEYTTIDQYVTNGYVDSDLTINETVYYKAFPYVINPLDSSKMFNQTGGFETILIEDVTPPVVAPLTIEQVDNYIKLDWVDSMENDFKETRVIKNSHEPATETDGEVIAISSFNYQITTFNDFDILPGTTYYYKTFTIDNTGNVNRNGVVKSITTPIIEALGSVSNFDLVQRFNNNTTELLATWEDPSTDNWKHTKIVWKKDGAPLNENDGYSKIITTKDSHVSIPLEIVSSTYEGQTWYFKAFTCDIYDNYNSDHVAVNLVIKDLRYAVGLSFTGSLFATSETNGVKIHWNGNAVNASDYALILRREGTYPTGYDDSFATVIYDGLNTNTPDGYLDTTTEKGKTYYYIGYGYYLNSDDHDAKIYSYRYEQGYTTLADDIYPILKVTREAGGNKIRVTEPINSKGKIIVLKKIGSYPQTINNRNGDETTNPIDDGTRLIDVYTWNIGTQTFEYLDTDIEDGISYYYTAFDTHSMYYNQNRDANSNHLSQGYIVMGTQNVTMSATGNLTNSGSTSSRANNLETRNMTANLSMSATTSIKANDVEIKSVSVSLGLSATSIKGQFENRSAVGNLNMNTELYVNKILTFPAENTEFMTTTHEKIRYDVTPPITNLTVVQGDSIITIPNPPFADESYNVYTNITWDENFVDTTNRVWDKTIIVRKLDSAPIDINDGVQVWNKTKGNYINNEYVDSELREAYYLDKHSHQTITLQDAFNDVAAGSTFYYKVFSIDAEGHVNKSGNVVNITLEAASNATMITDLAQQNVGSAIKLTWTDPSNAGWEETKIVIRSDRMPTTQTDGITWTITDFNAHVTDPWVNSGTVGNTYYCKLFPKIDGVYQLDSPGITFTLEQVGGVPVGYIDISGETMYNLEFFSVDDYNLFSENNFWTFATGKIYTNDMYGSNNPYFTLKYFTADAGDVVVKFKFDSSSDTGKVYVNGELKAIADHYTTLVSVPLVAGANEIKFQADVSDPLSANVEIDYIRYTQS